MAPRPLLALAATLLLVLLAPPLRAQTAPPVPPESTPPPVPRAALQGKVVDATTGQPVPEAHVTLRTAPRAETVTDTNGEFRFEDRIPGVHEIEVSRREWHFGAIAHVLSVYEARRAPGGELLRRGVNSLQFLNDGERWWILSCVWDNEREGVALPKDLEPGG